MATTTVHQALVLQKQVKQPRVFFAGLPMGHEFTSLILALLQTSGYAPKVSDEVLGFNQRLRS